MSATPNIRGERIFGSITGLTLLSATTISGGTLYGDGSNLSGVSTFDTFVTGGTYTDGSIIFTNNSGNTFTITGLYTGGTDVYVTGGTYLDGVTTFTNNTGGTFTVSGYYTGNTDVYVTGGTYLDGTATFTNNTGGTFSVNGFYTGSTDVFVTGGTYLDGNITFTNNTGGTFVVSGSAPYYSGVLDNSDQWISNGNGSMNLPSLQVGLYDNSAFTAPLNIYTIPSGTTGLNGINPLSDNNTNYIYIDYNGGNPTFQVTTNESLINNSNHVLYLIVFRLGNFVHVLDFGNQGSGLPNKINNRIIATNRFERESGFSLGLSGTSGVVVLTGGIAWNASNRQSLVGVNSQDDIFFQNFHSGGNWTYTTSANTLNNSYYDNGTDVVSGTTGKFLVNWYFRGQEINDHLYEVWGNDEYDSISEAQLAVEPNLPELITSHAFLVGRIIVEVNSATGLTESAFVRVFQSTQVQAHNDLLFIQGGEPGEYYHLDSNQYTNNAYTNVDNNFSVGQTFVNGLSATTISATTYYNLPESSTITGGTYNSGTLTLENNTGGTISITGFSSDVTITGGTYNSGTLTLGDSTGGTISVTGFSSGGSVSVSANTGLGINSGELYTIYNTLLDPSLTMASTIGGLTAGTSVSSLTGRTLVQLFDDLLFPTVLPTYTIPTILLTGVANQTLEVGSTFSSNLSSYGIKNDAGAYTQLRLLRNGSPLSTFTSLTITSESNVPNQFGYTNPNNPNYRYTISPTPYSESYIIPSPVGSNTSTSSTYQADGNYGAGLAKSNNKGTTDTRTPAVRSTNAPQAASSNFGSTTYTLTGIYPYFWGTSPTLPTASSIAAAIVGGTANKVLATASGTLSIPYNVSGQYIWVAYFNNYTTKTKWYVNALDNGNIDNSFITTAVTQSVNSPDGYWSGITYKMHWSVNATIQSTLEYRNS